MSERSILIGSRIKYLRTQRGLSQREIAKRIGVSQAHMSNMERGYSNITMENLLALHDTLKVPLSEIFKDVDEANESVNTSAILESKILNSKFTVYEFIQALLLVSK